MGFCRWLGVRSRKVVTFVVVSVALVAGVALVLQVSPVPKLAQASASSALPSWAMFHYGPDHTGLQPNETLLSTTTVGGLTQRWHKAGGTDAAVVPVSGPSGASEDVYTTTATKLFAYSGTTGVRRWLYTFGAGVGPVQNSSGVAISQSLQLVYVGFSGSSSTAVDAVRLSTGKLVWSAPWPRKGTSSCAPPAASVEAPLTLASSISPEVVGTAADNVYGQTSGGCVFALNAATGAVVWVTNGTTTTPVAGQTSPAVEAAAVGGIIGLYVFVGTYAGNLVVLSATTGGVVRSIPGCGDGESSPAVANGVVYSAGSRGLCAVSTNTGAVLWTNPCGMSSPSSPAVALSSSGATRTVFVGGATAPYVHDLCSISASSGTLKWARLVGVAGSSPAVANGVVYEVGNNPGRLYALNGATGKILFKGVLSPRRTVYWSSPVVANGWVYVGSDPPATGVQFVYAFS